MTNKILVLSTCATEEEAERLAKRLIDARLAACVSVIKQIRSFYRWEGRIEDSQEFLLVIKTSRELFDSLRTILTSAHSYQLPEVLAMPVIDGSPAYLAWLDRELTTED